MGRALYRTLDEMASNQQAASDVTTDTSSKRDASRKWEPQIYVKCSGESVVTSVVLITALSAPPHRHGAVPTLLQQAPSTSSSLGYHYHKATSYTAERRSQGGVASAAVFCPCQDDRVLNCRKHLNHNIYTFPSTLTGVVSLSRRS
ncbi:hypothetical protein BaRGS_00038971 [Batillaria attramentaria]|uniref:Uncharacterized protein n=1 Tax=Batillaria attramentaria TaxID=370345 RepID=A0ABD0J4B3_9CAEN